MGSESTMPYYVFFSTSQAYVQHFTVAAVSLLENNRDVDFHIYVIHEEMDMGPLNRSIAFLTQKYGVKVDSLKIGELDFSNFNTGNILENIRISGFFWQTSHRYM